MRYLILWFAFIVLFNGAFIGLELLEGNKITTSEYYGLRNLGVAFLFIAFILSSIASAAFLLVSAVLHRWARRVWPLHYAIYCSLGIYAGWHIFHTLYNESIASEYHLNMNSAFILFGLVGVLYSVLDAGLSRVRALQA